MSIDRDTLIRRLLADRAKVMAYVWAIIHDEHAAEDIYQDVTLLAIDKRDEIRDLDHLGPWLRAAARNKAMHWLRSQRKSPAVLDADVLELMDAQFTRHDRYNSSDVLDALHECIHRLSDSARQVIDTRYRNGLTGVALAEAVGQSHSAAYKTLTRAHGALARCIESRLAPNPEAPRG